MTSPILVHNHYTMPGGTTPAGLASTLPKRCTDDTAEAPRNMPYLRTWTTGGQAQRRLVAEQPFWWVKGMGGFGLRANARSKTSNRARG